MTEPLPSAGVSSLNLTHTRISVWLLGLLCAGSFLASSVLPSPAMSLVAPATSLVAPATSFVALTDVGFCQPVIVLQTTNTAVIALAQRMNASNRTAGEKWMQLAQTHASWSQVVNVMRSNPDNNPIELEKAKQMLSAVVYLRRYHEDNGPGAFPFIQVVNKLIFISL